MVVSIAGISKSGCDWWFSIRIVVVEPTYSSGVRCATQRAHVGDTASRDTDLRLQAGAHLKALLGGLLALLAQPVLVTAAVVGLDRPRHLGHGAGFPCTKCITSACPDGGRRWNEDGDEF